MKFHSPLLSALLITAVVSSLLPHGVAAKEPIDDGESNRKLVPRLTATRLNLYTGLIQNGQTDYVLVGPDGRLDGSATIYGWENGFIPGGLGRINATHGNGKVRGFEVDIVCVADNDLGEANLGKARQAECHVKGKETTR